jgi:drug/metabolite transporter (DMT)-like permease
MSKKLLVSFAMMIVLAVVYGATFTVNRLAADAGVPPMAYTFWQAIGAAVVLLIALTVSGDRLGVSRAHIKGYLVTGLLALGVPVVLLTYIAPKVPAGAMTLLLALAPPFTYMISMMIGIDRFRLFGLLGILFGLAGVAVLVGPGLAFTGGSSWEWYLLALAGPVMFAGSNVAAAVLRPPVASSASMASGVLFGAALPLIPVMAVTGQVWLPVGVSWAMLLPIVYAIVINAIGYVLFITVVRREGPTFFSQFNYFAVLCGVGWSMAVLGEEPTVYLFVAMILMFIGVFFSSYKAGAKTEATVAVSGG